MALGMATTAVATTARIARLGWVGRGLGARCDFVGGGGSGLRGLLRPGTCIRLGVVAPERRGLGILAYTKNGFAKRSYSASSTSTTPSPTHPQPDTPTSTSSTPPPPPKQRRLFIRLPIALALTLLTFTAGFIMAGAPALSSLKDLASPPSDAETLELFTPSTSEVAEIERQLFEHPLTKKLLQDPKYTASRPHLKIPEQLRAQNLTGGTLLGPDKIAVPPLQFSTDDGSSFYSLQYLGPALCGHPGIVHGGLLATLLDEGLARCCFPALPNKVGVTASLKIEYKRPCMAGQIVVLSAETTKVEGRKAWVVGRLSTLPAEGEEEGAVLTEGEALFIEPRQAAQMKRVVN